MPQLAGIREKRTPPLYQVGWRIRFILGLLLLLCAAFDRDPLFALVHVALASLLVHHLANGWAPLSAAMRLLRWLILPILLLHMFLTPGATLIDLGSLAVSREGLTTGIWLSLHLTEMFLAAMALSRMLSWQEWLRWFSSWPVIGDRLAVDVRLFLLMWRDTRRLIERQRSRWRYQHYNPRLLAALLVEMLQLIIKRSECQAVRLWRHWHSPRLQRLFVNGGEAAVHAGMSAMALLVSMALLYHLLRITVNFFG